MPRGKRLGKAKTNKSVNKSVVQAEAPFYVVEKIIDCREKDQGLEYKVLWKGYPLSEATWEPADNLKNVQILIDQYNAKMSFSRQDSLENEQISEASKLKAQQTEQFLELEKEEIPKRTRTKTQEERVQQEDKKKKIPHLNIQAKTFSQATEMPPTEETELTNQNQNLQQAELKNTKIVEQKPIKAEKTKAQTSLLGQANPTVQINFLRWDGESIFKVTDDKGNRKFLKTSEMLNGPLQRQLLIYLSKFSLPGR